ncbi:MAG: OmpH family outer membrane protein [Myxococcota bacterium]
MRNIALPLALSLLIPVAAHAEEVKIGYVDVQRALNEVEDGRQAKAALKKEFDEKQRILDEKQEELRVMKEELDKQGMMLSPEAKQEKLNDFQKRMLEMQQLYFNLQRDLSTREAEMTRGIFERMNRILNQIAEEEGYTVILERNESSILYARPHMDLTNELIRKYNKELERERKAAGGKGGSAGNGAPPEKDKKPKKKKEAAAGTEPPPMGGQ